MSPPIRFSRSGLLSSCLALPLGARALAFGSLFHGHTDAVRLREKGPALALLAVILAYAMCALVTRPRRTRSVASTTSTARRRRSSPSSWASCSPSPCWPTPLSEAPWPLSPPLPRRPRVLRVRREVIRWGRLCSACQPRRKEGVGPTISRRSRSADARQTSLPRAAHRPTRALPSRRGRGRAAVPAPPAPRPPRR